MPTPSSYLSTSIVRKAFIGMALEQGYLPTALHRADGLGNNTPAPPDFVLTGPGRPWVVVIESDDKARKDLSAGHQAFLAPFGDAVRLLRVSPSNLYAAAQELTR